MRRHTLLALFALVLSACDGTPTAPPSGPTTPTGPVLRASTRDTLMGVVHALPPDSLGVVVITLLVADHNSYYLIGPNAVEAARIDGSTVLVSGKLDSDTFWVDSFAIIGDGSDTCSTLMRVDDVPVECLVRITSAGKGGRKS